MNIYISNLSFDVNDNDLRELFEEYGEVSSAKVITDKFSGKSRGFGFVEMANDEEGQKAIEELNQAEYDGKTINVSVAKPRENRPERKPFSGGGGGGFGGNRGSSFGGTRGGYGGNRGGFSGNRSGGGDRGGHQTGEHRDRGYHNKF
jgi:RNA recognition motif-containing protein